MEEFSEAMTVEMELKLTEVLEKFQEVFKEPTQLPPRRPVDYKIHLTPDAKPVNLRPYIMSYHQKGEVEKIVHDLLQKSLYNPVLVPIPHQYCW